MHYPRYEKVNVYPKGFDGAVLKRETLLCIFCDQWNVEHCAFLVLKEVNTLVSQTINCKRDSISSS